MSHPDSVLINDFSQLVLHLNATQGTNAKIAILQKVLDPIKSLIKRIWDPDTTTGITADGIKKFEKDKKPYQHILMKDQTLIKILDSLTDRELTGDAAKATCVKFASLYEEHRDLLYGIFEKNPRVRLGSALILQALPGIFTIFKVALAKEFTEEQFKKQLKILGENIKPVALISKKYDGVRTICIIQDGEPKFFSREKKEFKSLATLKTDIMANIVKNLTPEELKEGIVFDGEIMAFDSTGRENFKETVSQIRQIDPAKKMPNPHYYVFDYMRLSVFEERVKGDILMDRINDLRDLFNECKRPKHVFITEQTPYDETNFAIWKKKATDEKWEGIMLRLNTFYEGKRTNNLLKFKFQHDAEYKVEDIVLKEMPFPNSTGGETFKKALNAVVILHKKNIVHVGSGFNTEERLKFAEDPSLILGHTITVKYQEEFYDPDTKLYSLRCPIFKVLHTKEGRKD